MSKTGRPAETDEQTRGVRVEVDLRGGCGVTNGKIASGYLFFLSFHQKRVKASTAMPITAMMIIGVIIDGSMMSLRTSVGGLDSPFEKEKNNTKTCPLQVWHFCRLTWRGCGGGAACY